MKQEFSTDEEKLTACAVKLEEWVHTTDNNLLDKKTWLATATEMVVARETNIFLFDSEEN